MREKTICKVVIIWRDGVPYLVRFEGAREVESKPCRSAERALAELLSERGV